MTKEDMIADLKQEARKLFVAGKDAEYKELLEKIRRITGEEERDDGVCESCQ